MAAGQEDSRQAENNAGVRKKILAGAAVLLVLICAACLYFFCGRTDSRLTVPEAPVMGVLDLQQAAKAHPDYDRLVTLRQEIGRLEAELAVGEMKAALPEIKPEEELLAEAAGQKHRLDAIERHSQLVERLNALAEQKRQELKPQMEAERSEVSRPYLNEVLNLRLKLDSADVLGITQAQAQQMLERIDSLQRERSAALDKLNAEQEERFRKLMEQEAAGPLAELRQLEAEDRQRAQQQEFEKGLAVQERNAREMEQALSPVQEKISNARRRTLLEAKQLQLSQLQEKIYNDIAGRAAKLAIMHGLTVILSSPADSLRGIDYERMQMGVWQPDLLPVLNVNTLDLTEEILQEMKTLQ
ncbi:hypothetical protein [Anaerovibrio sp.]|uniref:hypothetical protein n=1 Tax=Anaerovibrio sp. TaxID=1872532 RepID=UPI003F13B9EF